MIRNPRFQLSGRRPSDPKARCVFGQVDRPVPDEFPYGIQPTVGNAADDGAMSAGWFVGHFLDPAKAGLRATSGFEAKWSSHKTGEQRERWTTDENHATIVILIHGRLKLHLRDADHVLSKPGDYIIWGPGTDHSWSAEETCLVVTFRLPAQREDKGDT